MIKQLWCWTNEVQLKTKIKGMNFASEEERGRIAMGLRVKSEREISGQKGLQFLVLVPAL